jgi:eukaryotic-like serine/threonine-protein kinase
VTLLDQIQGFSAHVASRRMRADQYALVKALFAELCDLPLSERAARLRQRTNDTEVIEFVCSLLEQSQTPAKQIGASVQKAMTLVASEELHAGDLLGAWKIIAPIGQGGMGSLFLVERHDGHFQQRAALKVLKGIAHAKSLELLARERQLLASLAHPNIARLLDGGATPAGHPWLVMEFIDGLPIDRYCLAHKLDQRAVLRLFVWACSAVAFAHRQLIVHCDLKPANLLVNTEGRPILLDFGIAKLIDSSGSVLAVSPAYTPGYASPEQRRSEPVTVASDIYSLGVMLKELLAPGSAEPKRRASRRVRELSAIMQVCTADAPAARYRTVDALTDDIERFLQHLPLRAMPDLLGYRAEKLLRRRWPWLLAAATFLLCVTLFSARLILESQRAHRAEALAKSQRQLALNAQEKAQIERDRALQSEASARQISDFLVTMFEYSSPDAGTGAVPTEVLVAQALKRIDSELAGQPATQAQLYAVLARVQRVMGNLEPARSSLQQAIALERSQNRPLVLSGMLHDLAKMELAAIEFERALPHAEESVKLAQVAAPGSEALAEAYSMLGQVQTALQHRVAAKSALDMALGIRQALDPSSDQSAESWQHLGNHLREFQDYAGAINAHEQSIKIRRSLAGTESDEFVGALDSLAGAYLEARQFESAESALRESLAIQRRLYGDSARVAWALSQLGRVLNNSGRPLDSLPLYQEALNIGAKKFGAQSVSQAVLLGNQASACQRAGMERCAEKSSLAALAIVAKLDPQVAANLSRLRMNYALFLLQIGRLDEAQPLLLENYQLQKAKSVDNKELIAEAVQALLRFAIAKKDVTQAQRYFDELAPLRASLNTTDATTQSNVDALMLAAQGKIKEAFAAFEVARSHFLKTYGTHDARYWVMQLDRAELFAAQADTAQRKQAQVLAKEIAVQLRERMATEATEFKRIARLLAQD